MVNLKNTVFYLVAAKTPKTKARKRLFIKAKTSTKEREKIIKWAAENNYNTIVFPFDKKLNVKNRIYKLAKNYSLFIEAGGCELSSLMPRHLFMFKKDLFRMQHGERKSHCHFCPTNPGTILVIQKRAKKMFARFMKAVTTPRIFHILPDEGKENVWCACPACRAFNPAEQNIIAVNIAADALAEIDPEAMLGFLDIEAEQESKRISPRKNMFGLTKNNQ